MAQELIDKIRAAAQAKGIDPEVALRIARAESGLKVNATPGTSSAGGLFQVVDKTWKEFGGAPGKKFDPDENIRVGTDIIAKNAQTLKTFLQRDPRPAEVYAAHYFGPSGAKTFLSAEPGTPMESLFPANVIKANPNLKGKTSDQVMASLEKKMGQAPAAAPAPTVSRETPAPTPAEKIMEPALRSGMTAQAPVEEPAPDKLANLGPSYQAALALSFLADTEDKEDRDIDREPGIAEKWLAESGTRPTALAEFADVKIRSPFAEPAQPQMLAEGGEVEKEEESYPDAGRPTVQEVHVARAMFPDLPVAEAVYLLRGGSRQSTPQGEMLSGNLGVRIPLGKDADAMLMLAGSRPERGESSSKAMLAMLNQRLGEGNVGATLVRPMDAPSGLYAGNMSASYPLGEGRISGNLNAMRTPDGRTMITDYGVGYGGRVGPGDLSVGISRRANNGPYSGQVEYRLPVGRADGSPEEGEESMASKLLKEVVPMDLRMLGSTLMGNKSPITESNFNKEELAAMQQAVDKAAARTGRTEKGSVQYVDYPKGDEIGPGYQPVGSTLGRFVYEKGPNGQMVITDKYDFYNEGRKDNVEKYEKMGRGEKALSVSGNMLKALVTGNFRQIPNEVADAYIGRDGRDVRIKLPVKRADGSPEEGERLTPQQIERIAMEQALEREAASRPATVNPNIQRQGEAARRLAAMRDVNTLPDPKTYAAVSGFLGTAPDEMGFSALHPDREGIRKAGEAGFYTGTALQVAPIAGQAAKMLAKMSGSALNDRLLAGESLTSGFNTPAPINFAAKPKGGTFAYTPNDSDKVKPVTKLGIMLQHYGTTARHADASDEIVEFLKTKAPKYFTTTYGTASDPLRTAFRERRIQPFGTDIESVKPELINAANRSDDVGNLQARIDLERAYDNQANLSAHVLEPDNSPWTLARDIRENISEKIGQEGVTTEFRNPALLNAYSKSEFETYPSGTETLRRLYENQDKLPPHLQRALQTAEPMYDTFPLMEVLQPRNVIEALQQIPANKLKNMSFPEALIQGTQALAPVRDYLSAVALAEKGAKVPRQALDRFTTPVMNAPSFGGKWVTIDDSLGTRMEGKLLNHSVGDYSSGNSYGTAYTDLPYGGKKAFDEGLVRVYSLRDAEGLPKVTLEMAKSDGGKGNTWNVTQIRGRFNSEPLPETRNDIFSLLDKIDGQEGLNTIKPGRYSRSPTGEDVPRSMIEWAEEYDLYKQSKQSAE